MIRRWLRRRTPRLTLTRSDGRLYLRRWGFSTRWGGVFIHEMEAPDPGIDLHDHPWEFVSLILSGGYTEMTAPTNTASQLARSAILEADVRAIDGRQWDYLRALWSGHPRRYKRGQLNIMRLDRAHRIVHVEPNTWTLMVHGPTRKDRMAKGARADWGFYLPHDWVDEYTYDEVYRDRPLEAEFRGVVRP